VTIWVNSPFDALPGEGGRPMRYWLLCRALVAAGHSVVLWSSDFHHVTKSKRTVAEAYGAEGFQVRLVPTQTYRSNVCWRRWRSHAQYAGAWARLARESIAARELVVPDCIVLSMPPLGLYAAAARMKRAWRCSIVVDVQDAWPETFYRLLPRRVRWLARWIFLRARVLARRAYCGADGVTAVSERYARLAHEYGCRTKVGVFPLGCQLQEFAASAAPRGKEIRLCYVGNLGNTYDISTIVGGVGALAADGYPVRLEVAGGGPQGSWLSEIAARSGSPVSFHGYLDDSGLQTCLRSCDVGIVPMFASSWVAVPNKVADYAAAGLAMINGLEGETQTLLERYGAGLAYRTGDRSSFVQAVQRYVKDRRLLERHQRGARRLAEELFDAEKIYPEMARWIEDVAVR